MILTAGEQFNGKAAKRTHVMAKPLGAKCNLDCDYCYYLSKEELLDYKKGSSPQLDVDTLETYIKGYIEAQNTPEIVFSWQGGEPTLLGLEYFEKVVELQSKYCPAGTKISNDLQTNGTLINEKWAQFLKQHDFLVGLSIDGPEMLHNTYRTNKAGKGTFRQVMNAVEVLLQYGVPFNALTCVNNVTANAPLDVYRFLRDVVKPQQIQFIPIVERKDFRDSAPYMGDIKVGSAQLEPNNSDSIVEHWSVSAQQWGDFMCQVFDEWFAHDIGKVFVNYFEASFITWQGQQNPLCTLSELCGKGLAMEPNGDMFTCDHYVYPEHRVGNINTSTIETMAFSAKQQEFGFAKSKTLNSQCQQCKYKFACYGECPRNRFIATAEGEKGLNYLCQGWKKFFAHIDKPLSELLKANQLPVAFGKYKPKSFNLNFSY